MRYTKTQSLYLSRKGVLPDIVDLFGMSEDVSEVSQVSANEEVVEDEINTEEEVVIDEQPERVEPTSNEDDIDSFFG